MKEIEVQTENENKEIVKSSVVKIDENDDRVKVIVTVYSYNNRPIPSETYDKIHQSMVKAFESNCKVITVPDYIKINTIKI